MSIGAVVKPNWITPTAARNDISYLIKSDRTTGIAQTYHDGYRRRWSSCLDCNLRNRYALLYKSRSQNFLDASSMIVWSVTCVSMMPKSDRGGHETLLVSSGFTLVVVVLQNRPICINLPAQKCSPTLYLVPQVEFHKSFPQTEWYDHLLASAAVSARIGCRVRRDGTWGKRSTGRTTTMYALWMCVCMWIIRQGSQNVHVYGRTYVESDRLFLLLIFHQWTNSGSQEKLSFWHPELNHFLSKCAKTRRFVYLLSHMLLAVLVPKRCPNVLHIISDPWFAGGVSLRHQWTDGQAFEQQNNCVEILEWRENVKGEARELNCIDAILWRRCY